MRHRVFIGGLVRLECCSTEDTGFQEPGTGRSISDRMPCTMKRDIYYEGSFAYLELDILTTTYVRLVLPESSRKLG